MNDKVLSSGKEPGSRAQDPGHDKPSRRVALVTGGSRGIGRATALALARDGFEVIINYVQRADEAAGVVEAIVQATSRRALAHAADVSAPREVARMIQVAVATFGRLDVLVNNAGIAIQDTAPVISAVGNGGAVVNLAALEAWERMLRVNLTGAYLCSQAAAPLLAASGSGRIVNVSSLSAFTGGGPPGYVVSKAGLLGLTRSLAQQLGAASVTVNAVVPGGVATDMTPHFYPRPADVARVIARTPAGRYGRAEDVAEAVAFLASPRAGFITGQMLVVDGGRSWSQQGLIGED